MLIGPYLLTWLCKIQTKKYDKRNQPENCEWYKTFRRIHPGLDKQVNQTNSE